MSGSLEREPSQLFTLRVWRQRLGNGETEWRGRLEHVLSSEVHYFREWSTLVDYLIEILSALESQEERAINPIGSDDPSERVYQDFG